jgi:hypothetical protein
MVCMAVPCIVDTNSFSDEILQLMSGVGVISNAAGMIHFSFANCACAFFTHAVSGVLMLHFGCHIMLRLGFGVLESFGNVVSVLNSGIPNVLTIIRS